MGGPPAPETTVPPAIVTQERRRPPVCLWVVFPPALAGARRFDGDRAVVGRVEADGTDVAVGDPTVSRQHLAVAWNDGLQRFVAEDLGSKNGTWIDGAKVVSSRIVLADGAVLRLGQTVLVCEIGAPPTDGEDVSRDAVPGDSAAARALRAALQAAGPDPSHAVLQGETGTGKERIARELHRLSGRRGAFVAVNCAELAGELMESRLFGHARGSFTGAAQAQAGLYRAADGGTLLLDEIGELPAAAQPKLLRALQENEVLPVGETRAVRVDVRVIGATNRDLGALVGQGGFRRDLFARLGFWKIAVPPLRARRADFMAWLELLHARFQEQRPAAGRGALRFAADAVEALLLAPWLENLRGLDHLVHALAAARDRPEVIDAALVTTLIEPTPSVPEAEALELPPDRPAAPETREELEAALAREGSVHALARHYQRDRRQIYRWLKGFGMR